MREVLALEKVRAEFGKQDLEILAINLLTQYSLKKWRSYLQGLGLSNVIYAQDSTQKVVRALNVRSSGTTIILNKKGEEAYRDSGATSFEQYKSILALNL